MFMFFFLQISVLLFAKAQGGQADDPVSRPEEIPGYDLMATNQTSPNIPGHSGLLGNF